MKKTLLICLLGYLCVPISTLTAQVVESPPGKDLVYQPGIPGQEGESSSAPKAAVIWGMVSEYSKRDKVFLEIYQNYYFNSPNAPESSFVTMPLSPGKLMEGAYPKDKTFQYNLLDMKGNYWLSLKLEDSGYILDRMLVQPGDSVQVYIDLEMARVLFAGPQADKFRFQYELQLLEREYFLSRERVMVTDQVESILTDPVHGKDYQEVLLGAGPRMTFITRGKEELDRIENFDPYAPGGLLDIKTDFIDSWQDRLDSDFLSFFKKEGDLDVWRKHLAKINSALMFAEIRKDSSMVSRLVELGKKHLKMAEQEVESEYYPFSAELMDYQELKTRLSTRLYAMSDLEIIHSILPDWLREKALVRKFYEGYESIIGVDKALQDALVTIKDSKSQELLSALAHLKSTGSPVKGFAFLSPQGDTVSLSELDADLFLVEFWITGCKACVAFKENALTQIQDKYEQDLRLKVVTVSADFSREIWERSLASGKYTLPEFINLYTGEKNRNHEFLRQYGINSFPNRIILDGEGKILMVSNVPFTGDELIPILQGYLDNISLTDSDPAIHSTKQTKE
ncbi:TlpA family protein disulfide reductase [Algoriphagus aquimarinus]|uniref:Thioredoxin domain-containing protein n=1 Tax=Algoriphagus aquimarinus TaxID=237018 RepID=A0A5C7AA92_9BACT|nr:TlpA disulfide reductase family protein [Algoriphagus aquimarinus]TXE01852.1 hypothetical protein ESV85_21920 [Algoriphagus aquimarinus]